jgi:hypothetical protein
MLAGAREKAAGGTPTWKGRKHLVLLISQVYCTKGKGKELGSSLIIKNKQSTAVRPPQMMR